MEGVGYREISRMRSPLLNLYDEGASATALTWTDLYRTIQASRSLFHDGEAKTAATRVAPPGPAIETLKHSLAFSLGDPRAVVSDAEHEAPLEAAVRRQHCRLHVHGE